MLGGRADRFLAASATHHAGNHPLRGLPTCLDERHAGVNNDRTDALELATRLDRYVAGNQRALAVVRVPTEAEEQRRAHKRQRQQLREQRLSLAAQGPSLMLLNGRRESNHWWRTHRWEGLEPMLPAWLVERLKVFRDLILKAATWRTEPSILLPDGSQLSVPQVLLSVTVWSNGARNIANEKPDAIGFSRNFVLSEAAVLRTGRHQKKAA